MDVFEEGISKSYEPIKDIGSRVGFERGRVGRVKVSPSELAAYNLYKVLEKYPEYTKEARGQIQNYYKDFDGLETMNLPIFASVLSFLKRYPNPSPDSFKDENIMEFFINFIPAIHFPKTFMINYNIFFHNLKSFLSLYSCCLPSLNCFTGLKYPTTRVNT